MNMNLNTDATELNKYFLNMITIEKEKKLSIQFIKVY